MNTTSNNISGAAPAAVTPQGEWRIDTSTGRGILVYKNCSVIEAEQAPYVLGLIAADAAAAQGPALESPAAASKCAQCKKAYKPGSASVGCPKCAPGVKISEAEFQKPLEAPAAPAPAVPDGWRLVPIEFLRGFGTLAHNYSLTAIAPDHYWGNERSAFSDAYARCGQDLGKLREMLSAEAPPLAAAPQAPAAPADAEMLAALQAVAMDVVHVGAAENAISDAARAKVEAVLEKIGAPWPSPAAAPAAPAVDAETEDLKLRLAAALLRDANAAKKGGAQ